MTHPRAWSDAALFVASAALESSRERLLAYIGRMDVGGGLAAGQARLWADEIEDAAHRLRRVLDEMDAVGAQDGAQRS